MGRPPSVCRVRSVRPCDGTGPAGWRLTGPAVRARRISPVGHVRGQLLAAGLATPEEIDTHLANLARGDLDLMLAPMITAWGRKPDR